MQIHHYLIGLGCVAAAWLGVKMFVMPWVEEEMKSRTTVYSDDEPQ